MKIIPLFGTGVAGHSQTVTAQRRLNCYYEIREDGDKANIVIYGTPGEDLYLTLDPLPNGVIRGIHAAPEYLYVVAGSYIYKIPNDGSAATVDTTSMSTDSSYVAMIDNGQQLLIVDSFKGYIHTNFNSPGGSVSVIGAAGFPNGASTCAFLAGFFIAELPNTGQFYISGSYDGTSWDALDFATAEQSPDNIVGVDTLNGMLCVFSTGTIEWWQTSGALDFPFSPIPSATQTWGLAAVRSRAHVDNSIIFLAQNQQGQVQVMEFQGFVPYRVSTSDIENIINSFSQINDAVALSYLIDGHPMYQLTFPAMGRSFLYDALTRMWSEVQTGTALTARHNSNFSAVVNGEPLVTDHKDPYIYKLNPKTYTDNGTPIRREVRTRHIMDNGNVFGVDEVFIDMETGVGLQTGQGSDPKIMMQSSKDNGRTWGPERWTSLGKVGQYKGPRVIWRRWGSARDMVFKIAMTDPVKFVITYGAATIRERVQ